MEQFTFMLQQIILNTLNAKFTHTQTKSLIFYKNAALFSTCVVT